MSIGQEFNDGTVVIQAKRRWTELFMLLIAWATLRMAYAGLVTPGGDCYGARLNRVICHFYLPLNSRSRICVGS